MECDSMKIELYNDIHDKKSGYCCSKSHIRVNMAHHELSVQLKATIVHEITHAILHFNKKHYTPIEKEFQARMVEYNYCHSLESKRALIYYKKLLQEENRNINPLREEVRRVYPEILRISSLSWSAPINHHKNFSKVNKMSIYKENTREFRLLSEISGKLTDEFGAQAPVEAVKSFIKNSEFRVRPVGVINDLSDNKLAKVVDDIIYFNNEKGGEKESLSEEMVLILKIISEKKELSRDDFLATLAEEGYSRTGRSLLQEARKLGLIKGLVRDKIPIYVKVED